MGEKSRFEPPASLHEEHALTLERSKYMLEHIAEQDKKISTDSLTGLTTRAILWNKFEQALKAAQENSLKEVSIIAIDIDHFKKINDTYGHPVGDEILRRVGALLRASMQGTNHTAARMGGEELMILMPDKDIDAATAKAEELRAAIKEMTFDGHPDLKVTASFGIESSKNSTDPQKLYDLVDKMLYVAKHNGRNRVEVPI